MSNKTKTVIDTFISQFGNTPNGVTPLQYGAGTSYSDASNSESAKISNNNIHSQGEFEGTNYVRTLFVSVENEVGDEEKDGVNLLTYTPAVTYQSNVNGITDPRLVHKLHFQGAQFLTLSSDGQTLVPLGRTTTTTNSTATVNRGSSGVSSGGSSGGSGGGGY